jgi:hypothetical protein
MNSGGEQGAHAPEGVNVTAKYGALQAKKKLANSTQQYFDSADWQMRGAAAGKAPGGHVEKQLKPAYVVMKEGGSPRKEPRRNKSNLGGGA